MPRHVEQARAGRPSIDAVVGDARALPEPGSSQDATLVLGPLYHLHERVDRVRVLREAIRVTRPGGRIAAAAIARFAGPIDFAATARFDERMLAEAHRLITSGVNDPAVGFTHAYFHRVPELRDERREAGLENVVIHGVEGPAWPAAEAAVSSPSFPVISTPRCNWLAPAVRSPSWSPSALTCWPSEPRRSAEARGDGPVSLQPGSSIVGPGMTAGARVAHS